jgi:hypothetical protein
MGKLKFCTLMLITSSATSVVNIAESIIGSSKASEVSAAVLAIEI